MHCPGGNATDPFWRVLASSNGISSWTHLKPQHNNPNPKLKPSGQSTVVYWLPYSSNTSHRPSQTPCLPWISYATQKQNILGYPKRHQVKQSALGLSSKLWCLKITNHVKFTKECVMWTEKHVLVKSVYKWAKLRVWVGKKVHRIETLIRAQQSLKTIILTVFRSMETDHYWFPWNLLLLLLYIYIYIYIYIYMPRRLFWKKLRFH